MPGGQLLEGGSSFAIVRVDLKAGLVLLDCLLFPSRLSIKRCRGEARLGIPGIHRFGFPEGGFRLLFGSRLAVRDCRSPICPDRRHAFERTAELLDGFTVSLLGEVQFP